jgi:hypothetical protein
MGKNRKAMTIVFQFHEISIQVIPANDLCFIWKNSTPIWSGSKNELIEILEAI